LPSGGGWFDVQVDDGIAATTLFSTTTNSDVWRHHWSNLSPWSDQIVTMTFNVHQTTGEPCTWAFLDEVTLGSAYPDLWVRPYSAAALPDEQVVHTIAYGNRGGAPANSVRVTVTLPSELFFVDANPVPVFNTLLWAWEWDLGDLPAKSGFSTIALTTPVASTATLFSTLASTFSIGTASTELETANNLTQSATFVSRQVCLPVVMKEY
jgi:uncharacterized repeat protein (TIGR01451 family)